MFSSFGTERVQNMTLGLIKRELPFVCMCIKLVQCAGGGGGGGVM